LRSTEGTPDRNLLEGRVGAQNHDLAVAVVDREEVVAGDREVPRVAGPADLAAAVAVDHLAGGRVQRDDIASPAGDLEDHPSASTGLISSLPSPIGTDHRRSTASSSSPSRARVGDQRLLLRQPRGAALRRSLLAADAHERHHQQVAGAG